MMNSSVSYCERLGIKVFLPEYRISLEDSCDTIIEDCYHMLKYVFENAERLGVDKGRVLVYGDSAGGCLAESVTLLNRDRENYHLRGQMLVYPVCDNESEKYLKRGTKNIAYVVPIKSDLKNLPPAYIEPQEIDILRDEAVAYADKLKAAGVAVEVNIIPGSYHGFDSDFRSSLVKQVYEKRYQVINRMLI